MNVFQQKTRLSLPWVLLIAFMASVAPQSAQAVGTASGTLVTNQASLDYSVGGVAQTAIQSDGDAVTAGVQTTDFVVDTKIDLTVATVDGAAIAVIPGSTAQVTTFTVTNTGNATQDFGLASTALAGGAAAFGGTDTIDMNNVQIFVDSNGNGTYDAGVDTATFIDELAADGVVTVFIVADTPATAVDGDIASYHLVASALAGGGVGAQGAALTETAAGAETLAAVDTLFADGQGSDTANDIARDAKHSSQDDYLVSAAQVSMLKTATTVSDPIKGTTNPLAIPGATMRYTLQISNGVAATSSAVLSTISDALNANLLVVSTAGNATWTVTGSTRAVATGTLTADTADANADGLGHSNTAAVGGTLTATITTILAADGVNGYVAGELKPGETLSITFDVVIQ